MLNTTKTRARVALVLAIISSLTAVQYIAACSASQRAAERASLSPDPDACLRLEGDRGLCITLREVERELPRLIPLILAARARDAGVDAP